jgi:hypothetical protein
MSIALCIAAFLLSFVCGRASRVAGLVMTLAVGYVYGIVRANVNETFSHFIFDCAVLGFYITQFFRPFDAAQQARVRQLKPWIVLLVTWPIILFFAPVQDWLVQLIGLRGSIFLLPFIFVGALLDSEERRQLAVWLALLNIAAFAFAVVQFFVGVEQFFPRNEVTYLIYKSKDVAQHTAYRIPSFFNNSHSYSGAITLTLPLLLSALVTRNKAIWLQKVVLLGLVATLLGIFMAAARTPVIVAGIIIVVATFSLRTRIGYAAGWLFILVFVGWIVSNEARLQRFTELQDADAIAMRLSASVNMGFIEAAQTHPFGNGLGGGGTSMPYWMERQIHRPVAIENEYARIMLEQGVIGLFFWIAFLGWALTRYFHDSSEKWNFGRRLALITCATQFLLAVSGTGTLTAIPSTCLLLLLLGWVTSSTVPVCETYSAQPHRLSDARARA